MIILTSMLSGPDRQQRLPIGVLTSDDCVHSITTAPPAGAVPQIGGPMFVKSTAGPLSFLALTLFGVAIGRSQDVPSASGVLNEIVVTAQRRKEKLSDVPISMSVVTGATMEAFGEKDLNQYAAGMPNLAITSGAGAGGNGSSFGVSSTRAIAIRGVFGNNTTSLYLNDTPIPVSL